MICPYFSDRWFEIEKLSQTLCTRIVLRNSDFLVVRIRKIKTETTDKLKSEIERINNEYFLYECYFITTMKSQNVFDAPAF